MPQPYFETDSHVTLTMEEYLVLLAARERVGTARVLQYETALLWAALALSPAEHHPKVVDDATHRFWHAVDETGLGSDLQTVALGLGTQNALAESN
jgi:hypothetical protein